MLRADEQGFLKMAKARFQLRDRGVGESQYDYKRMTALAHVTTRCRFSW